MAVWHEHIFKPRKTSSTWNTCSKCLSPRMLTFCMKTKCQRKGEILYLMGLRLVASGQTQQGQLKEGIFHQGKQHHAWCLVLNFKDIFYFYNFFSADTLDSQVAGFKTLTGPRQPLSLWPVSLRPLNFHVHLPAKCISSLLHHLNLISSKP